MKRVLQFILLSFGFSACNSPSIDSFSLFLNKHNNLLIQEYCDSVIVWEESSSPFMFLIMEEVFHSDTVISISKVPYPTLFVDIEGNLSQKVTEYNNIVILLAAFNEKESQRLYNCEVFNNSLKAQMEKDISNNPHLDNWKREYYQLFKINDEGILIPYYNVRDCDFGFEFDDIIDTTLELSDSLFTDDTLF